MRIGRLPDAGRTPHHPSRRLLLAVRLLGVVLVAASILTRLPVGPGGAHPIQPSLDAIGPADTTPLSSAFRLTPPPQRPFGKSEVFIVGDSLTFGADYFGKASAKLVAAGYQARIDGKVARFMPAGATLLQTEATAGRLEPLVMVGLGTNEVYAGRSNAQIGVGIDQVMAAVGDRWVIWINVQLKDAAAASRFNRILEAKAAFYHRLLIADWSITKNLQYLQFDGVHLSPTGYVNRAIFMVDTLNAQTH